ncbi:MAG: FHA domain-containing protein [Opitutales bacterium]
MDTPAPHLLIEEGPEKGRELVIPEKGARLGRALENDITIADAAMSRFQCRMYFRDDFLHIMDLGSTNETLVNNEPVSDLALRYGDEILIGESLIKVINDGLHENRPASPPPGSRSVSSPPASEPEPAPIIFNVEGGGKETASPAAPPPPTSMDVDLGLGRRDQIEEQIHHNRKRSTLSLLLVTLITMAVVFGIGLMVVMNSSTQTGGVQEQDDRIRVVYEKVIAGNGNIFRYALALDESGQVAAQVHDLRQQRSITRTETISPERIEYFREQAIGYRDGFLALQDEYEGLPVGTHESYRLTMIYGKDAKTVRVANQLEPEAFKRIREQLEAFANNELGLINIQIPPEELRARADESWENAQNLYEQRDVKNANLWDATQKLKDVLFLLETIEPKPDYYQEAARLREEWRRDLMDKVRQLDFEAVRAYQVGEIAKSAELYRRILATYPDKTANEYKTAYTNLVRIEQELNR